MEKEDKEAAKWWLYELGAEGRYIQMEKHNNFSPRTSDITNWHKGEVEVIE
jgi:hypothetical protein